MRKIFSSQRLENAEAVARLLEAEGIEVRIEHGRGLRRAIRGNFSYRDNGQPGPPPPTVWVIRSDDQPRARALMREAGLLQDTTRNDKHLLPSPATANDGKKRISRLRYGLLALVLIIATVHVIRRPAQPPMPAHPAPAPEVPQSALSMLDDTILDAGDVHVIATPPLLAQMLVRRLLDAHPVKRLCLAIDGQVPADIALDALAAAGITAHPASTCPPDITLHLDIHHYTTDGSGTGTVQVAQRAKTQETASSEELTVRRTGHVWAVLEDGNANGNVSHPR